MKTKSFTSAEVGEWLAVFSKNSTVEEYRNIVHALRCVFDADGDKEFWNEACGIAKNQ